MNPLDRIPDRAWRAVEFVALTALVALAYLAACMWERAL